MTFKCKIKGEKWGMIRTDIMREFKNIEVKGHFLSESTVWFRIAKKYHKKLFLQQCLRIYEVHEDSVTKQIKTNAAGIQDLLTLFFFGSCFIYLNEFYSWYLRYQVKSAIRKPFALTYACIVNDKSILFGNDALINKVNPLLCKNILQYI